MPSQPSDRVRLTPNVSTTTRSGEGRVTPVRTNALGFRDLDWAPAPEARPVPRAEDARRDARA